MPEDEHSMIVQGKQGHGRRSAGDLRHVRGFQLLLRTFVYIPDSDTFEPVPAMPRQLPQQICQALYTLKQIDTAGTCTTIICLGTADHMPLCTSGIQRAANSHMYLQAIWAQPKALPLGNMTACIDHIGNYKTGQCVFCSWSR